MKDDFAAKLISGKALASAKASWWPRHCRALGRYVNLSGGNTPNAQNTAKDELAMGWAAWESAVSVAAKKGFMEQHTELEMALVDASFHGDEKKIESIGSMLLDNATEQADAYALAVDGFPKAVFLKLLQEHVFVFVKSVRSHCEKKKRSCEEMEHSNTLALAAFTAEWL